MAIQIEDHAGAEVILPARWDERLAQGVSDVLAPPFTGLAGLLVMGFASKEQPIAAWIGLALVLNIIIPVGYVLWQVRRGAISDFHITIRSQRMRPILLSLGCTLVTLLIFWLGGAPEVLLRLTLAGLFFVIALFLITRQWKISGHCAAMAGVSLLVVRMMGAAYWPALLLVPLVAWARVRIRRHTLAQAIGGALLGLAVIQLAAI